MDADEVIELLGLEPLPGEGGQWAQTWRDEHSSAIYFLLRPGDFSALHRLGGVELWHHYSGAAVEMLLLQPGGTVSRPRLGTDLANGERPVVVVEAATWMAAGTTGEWSLARSGAARPAGHRRRRRRRVRVPVLGPCEMDHRRGSGGRWRRAHPAHMVSPRSWLSHPLGALRETQRAPHGHASRKRRNHHGHLDSVSGPGRRLAARHRRGAGRLPAGPELDDGQRLAEPARSPGAFC